MERWKTKTIISDGGYDIVTGIFEQGTLLPGSARKLLNYEPAENRGYRKVLGYTKFDTSVVPGEALAPVLGVYPKGSTVYTVRKSTAGTPSYDIYSSTGSGWTKLNSSARTAAVTKARFTEYSLTEPVIIVTDGSHRAYKIAASGNTELAGSGAPTNPAYAVEHKARLVLAGYSANRSAIILSAPNDDTNYTAGAGAIEIVVGDVVVGLRSFRQTLYIFCQSSIHKLTGTSSANFAIESVSERIGCISGDTIQEVGGDIIFLAPDGLRSLAATERVDDIELGLQSTSIQPELVTTIKSAPTQYSSISIPTKSQYRLFTYVAGVDSYSQKGYLGKFKPTENKQYIWSTILGFSAYCAGSSSESGANDKQVIGHPTNGLVYQLESSGGFDGGSIPYEYSTPAITFDDINILKVIYKLAVLAQAEGNVSLSISITLDEYEQAQVTLQPATKTIVLTSPSTIFGIAIFDTDVFSEEAKPLTNRLNVEGSCKTLTITVSGNDTSLPHRIDGFIITYIDKSRKTDD